MTNPYNLKKTVTIKEINKSSKLDGTVPYRLYGLRKESKKKNDIFIGYR